MKKHHEKSGMIDNRMVKDSHQEGISRVIQRGKMPTGQPGKMSEKPSQKAHWKRSEGSLTPRRG